MMTNESKPIANESPRVLMTRETYEALPDASGPLGILRKASVDNCGYVIDSDGAFCRAQFGVYIREG